MKQLDKKQKLWLTIGIGSAIILLYAGLVVYPQISDLLDLNDKIYKQQVRLAELDIQQADLNNAKDKEKEINYLLNQLSLHLTTEDEILDFIVLLEDIAEKTNNTQEISVTKESVKPQATKNENEDSNKDATNQSATNGTATAPDANTQEQATLSVQVKLNGSFNNLISYLIELQKAAIISDQTALDTQLASIISSQLNQDNANEPTQSQESDLATTLDLKVYLKNANTSTK